MDKQNAIHKTKLLLVEGNHERDVFNAWLKALDRTDIQVMPIAGKTRLRDELGLLVKQTAFPTVTSLVVVRDADDNPATAFISVHDALDIIMIWRSPRSKPTRGSAGGSCVVHSRFP
jgi:hypothetical protein